ncbi:hypothetical protein ACFZBM_15175 [Streptomyces lavendulae]|uniref:Uncharacterized protein n=1 Tax=Streptomyces lavendulae subsp. lavendulae TaxID=58340 RepID=A0A2K8PH09_STRLA|nr:hypothetical protein [Streptomyces lavendulae]ATZ26036.1 hypothetical protein SLAV_21080 [Streptomyces lavendulae subsp. lavendulae]QUQ55865.1 hypothetical protein SLLC_19190 [Streptomyces lavendulae subsp. lavendulae]GLW01199.1 hypothetical protein Slala05_48300 [Streptomyces lavendulae subsp. lavendulae]
MFRKPWYRSFDLPQPTPAARIRGNAVLAALLFVPALVLAKVLVLATETGGRCLAEGGCPPFPGTAFLVLTAAAAVALAGALAAPQRMRRAALGAQLLLEAVAVGLVPAYP